MEPHKLDVISLIAGLTFLAAGVGHLVGVNLWRIWHGIDTLLPVLVIVAGAVLLIRVLRRTRDDEIT